MNDLLQSDSGDYLTCIQIAFGPNSTSEVDCLAKWVYVGMTRSVVFDQVPEVVQQAAVEAYTIAKKMKDGRITKDGRIIDPEDIAEYAALLRDGDNSPEDGFEEAADIGNTFGELRL